MMLRFLTLLSIIATGLSFVTPPNAPRAFVPNTSSSSALNVAVSTADIKNGLTIELDGEPYKVVSFSIMKQARGAAKTTIKFKNLMRGTTIENTYRSGEKFETAQIEKQEAQYTYKDENDNYLFMDSETFEEVMVPPDVVEDMKFWLSEGMICTLVTFKSTVIEVVVPQVMEFDVVDTEPNVKGNTSSAHTKPATLDCGAVVTVPGFVKIGDRVKVDTGRSEYMERV